MIQWMLPLSLGEVDKEMKVVVGVVAEILEKGAAKFGYGETEKGKEKRSGFGVGPGLDFGLGFVFGV
ncbi:hypothetical protein ACLB2K_046877 [Fragaria x ananassa]